MNALREWPTPAPISTQAGVDAIELSGGTGYASGDYSCCRVGVPAPQDREIYYKEAARRYKENMHVPLLLVSGIRSPEVAESVIGTGLADYISLCRPLIREPNLIDRWKAETLDQQPANIAMAAWGQPGKVKA